MDHGLMWLDCDFLVYEANREESTAANFRACRGRASIRRHFAARPNARAICAGVVVALAHHQPRGDAGLAIFPNLKGRINIYIHNRIFCAAGGGHECEHNECNEQSTHAAKNWPSRKRARLWTPPAKSGTCCTPKLAKTPDDSKPAKGANLAVLAVVFGAEGYPCERIRPLV